MQNHKYSTFSTKKRILILFLVIFQSIGIRFFEGQGITLSIIIISLLLQQIAKLNVKDVLYLGIAFSLLMICKISNSNFTNSSFLYQSSLIFSAYLALVQYRNTNINIENDLFVALSIYSYHAAIGYAIYLIKPSVFVSYNEMQDSFLNTFFISNTSFSNLKRNTGILWEPGNLQLLMNLLIFLSIKLKKKLSSTVLAVLMVFSTFSTAGFIILIINVIYFLTKQQKGFAITAVITGCLLLTYPFVSENIRNKTDGENTSGLIRLRDLYIGFGLIKEKPLLGHGIFDSSYLIKKPYVSNIQTNLFSNKFIEESGEMGGGYTNGLLGLIAWYGIPSALILYILYFNNKIISGNKLDKFIFSIIPILTLISEPISYTSLFLLFPFSFLILRNRPLKIRYR